jgi:hypothetical protein
MSNEAKFCAGLAACAVALWAAFMLWGVQVPVVGERAREAPQGQGEASYSTRAMSTATCFQTGQNSCAFSEAWTSTPEYARCQMGSEEWYERGNICHSDPQARQ